jgi:hypothetical protein
MGENLNNEYAISTFCYGDIYYEQTNRLIESFLEIDDKPNIFVVTDNPDKIRKESWVNINNIKEYNEKYQTYNTNYYDFDFSVKRYSVKFALENNYSKIILSDTDVVANNIIFSHNNILKLFLNNSISGQVTYLFDDEINRNSELGKRFQYYEKKFNVKYSNQNFYMPEDCIQFLDIEKNKFESFLNTWDECIKIKYEEDLRNIPAGNIDEMCFSAFHNGIDLKNNSGQGINLLIPKHNKWY